MTALNSLVILPEGEPPAPHDGLQAALREAFLCVPVLAADPFLHLGVLLLPRVGRRQDEQPAMPHQIAGLDDGGKGGGVSRMLMPDAKKLQKRSNIRHFGKTFCVSPSE